MSTTLIRANRVAVKANGENFVADFYRTHKALTSINSEDTDWTPPEDATNKTAMRESFRQWAIANCEEYGIYWKPEDMRAEGNIRKAKYDTDQALIDDAMSMLIPEIRKLIEKCKYDISWNGVSHEEIIPMTQTGTGRDLSTLGISDGKYEKSGNWAWANLKFIVTFNFKGEECYIQVIMQLVSGQLKKVGIGITEFNNRIKTEILDAELATEEELDPPKSSKKSGKATKDTDEEDTEDATDVTEDVEEDADEEAEEVTVNDVIVDEDTVKTDDKKSGRQRRARKSKKNNK